MGYHRVEKKFKSRKNGKEYVWHTLVFKVDTMEDWLHTKGGRDKDDVIGDENGLYVEMTTYDKSNKVYIPNRYCKPQNVI